MSHIGLYRHNALAVLFALGLVIGGTWIAVKFATDSLLYQDARSAAHNWARLLAQNVADLEQIAAGEQPSTASMTFFTWAQKAGQVFRYEIYNRYGYSQLTSENGIAQVSLSEFSPDAVAALSTNQAVIDVKEADVPGRPAFYAQAYVPVLIDSRPVAIVAAYVDQTERREQLNRTFLISAIMLCLLSGFAFGIPAVAWYRRTNEKQQADRRIRYLAHHDVMTGLSNRTRLVEKLDIALATLPSWGGCIAVHFLDIDRFKSVNDTFGHDGGDFLLKVIAERLRAETRAEDVVGRFGGDEFVIVQCGIAGRDQVETLAARLISAMAAPIRFKDQDIAASVSIGVALAPADGTSSERLLKSADLALYTSKAAGRNCARLFAPEMDAALLDRIRIERSLRDALDHGRLRLHYQPVFEITDRQLVGFEALLRLSDENGNDIPPAVFIPIAEETRLIEQIGAWVLMQACRAATKWPEHLTVAVNLSPAQFENGKISEVVSSALEASRLLPRRLELEITESLLLGDTEVVLKELRAIKAMGVSIAMDDFGTGYSSLGHLWRFPFDKIKVDRSFMQGFDDRGRNAATIVRSIISLGRELDVRVTIEGVETERQAAFLDEVHADQVQGYYFGRPLPEEEIPGRFMMSQPSRRALTRDRNEVAPELSDVA